MEQEFNIQPYGIKMMCDKCDGEMKPLGNIILTCDPPRYPHTCDKCGYQSSYTEKYPTVRWRLGEG